MISFLRAAHVPNVSIQSFSSAPSGHVEGNPAFPGSEMSPGWTRTHLAKQAISLLEGSTALNQLAPSSSSSSRIMSSHHLRTEELERGKQAKEWALVEKAER